MMTEFGREQSNAIDGLDQHGDTAAEELPSSSLKVSSSERLKSHTRQRLALLASTLEMWCHQILYVRRVYPKDTFCPVGFLSATTHCKANRHPAVVSYITDAIRVAVPTIFLQGAATELTLVVLNRAGNCTRQLESYSLDFSELSRSTQNFEGGQDLNQQPLWKVLCLDQLEREMLDLVLSVHSQGLAGKHRRGKSNLSFQIMLRVTNREKVEIGCEEVDSALSAGTWYFPTTPKINEQVRPIHHVIGFVQFSSTFPGTA